jgi:hypothetical protein
MDITNKYILEKIKTIVVLFLLTGSTLSCQNTKDQVVPLHTVAYNFKVLPPNRYIGFITYLNREGKLDSATTSSHWIYEFKAKKGTILHASVSSKPKRYTDRVIAVVSLRIVVDGDTLYSGIGRSLVADYKIE